MPKPAKQVARIMDQLAPLYEGKTALHWSNPLELMVAVILSAQCTDVRVNKVTSSLFKKYRDALAYASADPVELEEDIRSTGFFRNKTKNIIAACQRLVAEYHGAVPRTMGEMISLPGVGRKSASIILAEGYGVIAGIPVDTHVKRLAKRLGLTDETDPEKIEQELMPVVPEKDWYKFSSALIYHGRAICQARRPKCQLCIVNDICPSAFSF